jgi:hypothetical protein
MARKAEYLREENRVLKEAFLEATGKTRIPLTDELRRRRLAAKRKVFRSHDVCVSLFVNLIGTTVPNASIRGLDQQLPGWSRPARSAQQPWVCPAGAVKSRQHGSRQSRCNRVSDKQPSQPYQAWGFGAACSPDYGPVPNPNGFRFTSQPGGTFDAIDLDDVVARRVVVRRHADIGPLGRGAAGASIWTHKEGGTGLPIPEAVEIDNEGPLLTATGVPETN